MKANRQEILRKRNEVTRKLVIEKCKTDFFTFLKYMFPNKEVTWNWHHRYVCGLLQRFVLGDISNLMVFMPPQHQKSTMMTEYLPAWLFGVNPNAECLLVMYNATMAAKYNRKIQRVIDNEQYAEIFPNTALNQKNVVSTSKGSYVRNSDEFEIVNHRGFLKATGIGGGIAGNPAKFTFMDDVIKNVAEANSKTYRDKIYEWQTDELEARQHNDSRIAFTITRRHEDDLAGRLIKRDGILEDGGKWKVVKLPALKENNDNKDDPRKIGEALFPLLHSRERMEYIRDKNPRTFQGLYQQNPTVAGGNIVKAEWIFKMPHHALPNEVRNGVIDFVGDTAFTEKSENDPSALLGYVEHDGFLYLMDYTNVRKDFPGLKRHLKAFVGVVGSEESRVYIEPKASGISVVQELKGDLNIIEYRLPKGDKISRLNSVVPYIESGRVVFVEGKWNESFLAELFQFPKAKHDEAVDLICMAITQGLTRNSKKYTGDADYA